MRLLAALFTTLLLFGCGGRPSPAPAPKTQQATASETDKSMATPVSFAKDIQSLAATSCMPCHAGANSSRNWTVYQNVNAIVVAGNPESSKFFQVLNDGRMPPGRKLDSTKIALVYRWIRQGAKNN